MSHSTSPRRAAGIEATRWQSERARAQHSAWEENTIVNWSGLFERLIGARKAGWWDRKAVDRGALRKLWWNQFLWILKDEVPGIRNQAGSGPQVLGPLPQIPGSLGTQKRCVTQRFQAKWVWHSWLADIRCKVPGRSVSAKAKRKDHGSISVDWKASIIWVVDLSSAFSRTHQQNAQYEATYNMWEYLNRQAGEQGWAERTCGRGRGGRPRSDPTRWGSGWTGSSSCAPRPSVSGRATAAAATKTPSEWPAPSYHGNDAHCMDAGKSGCCTTTRRRICCRDGQTTQQTHRSGVEISIFLCKSAFALPGGFLPRALNPSLLWRPGQVVQGFTTTTGSKENPSSKLPAWKSSKIASKFFNGLTKVEFPKRNCKQVGAQKTSRTWRMQSREKALMSTKMNCHAYVCKIGAKCNNASAWTKSQTTRKMRKYTEADLLFSG